MTKNFAEQTFTGPSRIRNFCIITYIGRGKSTLVDRVLQLSGVIEARDMHGQYLGNMNIEHERGITIKAQNMRLSWAPRTDEHVGEEIVLHLIDTPGHVDFTYEVSRALGTCEGTILPIDAAQGIEAQTLANLYLTMEDDLKIIPVLNKIDLLTANPDRHTEEVTHIISCEPEDVMRVSGKAGESVEQMPGRVCELVPASVGDPEAPACVLIFGSVYDTYRGVVTCIRVVDGQLKPRKVVQMMSTGTKHELSEIGVVSPQPKKCKRLGVGEVGYLITDMKDVRQSRVGDTVALSTTPAEKLLGGYEEPKPVACPGLFPISQADYPSLRNTLEELQLDGVSLTFEPETSVALGFGFRGGFLGLLHMEIACARLEHEFSLDLISIAPDVAYRAIAEDDSEVTAHNLSGRPEGKLREIYEPMIECTIVVPSEFASPTMELCQQRRGEMGGMGYLSEDRVELRYKMPPGEIIFDFFNMLKSRIRSYASLSYKDAGEQLANLVKVSILLQGEAVDAFSAIVHRDNAQWYGNRMTKRLRELIPRRQFEVPVQTAIGSKTIARESIRALRKGVLAKCYGGGTSRKHKLLKKQKTGRKYMKSIGPVSVLQGVFMAALSTGEGGK